MVDRSDTELGGRTQVERRSLLMLFAAGMLTPLIGTGTARADSATEEDEPHQPPEDSGALPWW